MAHKRTELKQNLADFLTAIAYDSPLCNTTKISSSNIVPGENSALKPLFDEKDPLVHNYVIQEFGDDKVGIIGVDVRNKTMEASKP